MRLPSALRKGLALLAIAWLAALAGCTTPLRRLPDEAPRPVDTAQALRPVGWQTGGDPEVRPPLRAPLAPGDQLPPPRLDEKEPPPEKKLPGTPEKDEKALSAPLGPPLPKLTFDEVIGRCLGADPKLRAAREEVNQAIGDLITASLKPNPTLTTDVQLLPLQRLTIQEQGGPPQFDLGVNWKIDWWLFGKRLAAMINAGDGVRVTEATFANVVRERVRDAAVAYYDLVEGRALVEVARQDVANLAQLEAVTRKAVKAGGRAQVELSRIQLNRLISERALREAEAAVANARSKLGALLGRTGHEPSIDVEGSLEGKLLPPPPVDHVLSVAQQNRPDILTLALKVRQGESSVVSEDRKGYPEVTPRVGYSYQFQHAIGFPNFSSWLVGVDVDLPFFDRNQGNRFKARSELAQRHHEMEMGMVELKAEVEQAVQDYAVAYANAQAVTNEQVKLATEVRDRIRQAYEAGGRPLLDVLDAQRNYLETYRSSVQNRAAYWRARVRLQAVAAQKLEPEPGKRTLPDGKCVD